MARTTGSWLSGFAGESGGPDQESSEYPGQRFGLPPSGPGSIARFGRRVGALLIDWLIAYGLAALAMTFGVISMSGLSTAVLVVWFVLGAVSVRLFGFSPGQLAVGLRVASTDHRLHVGIGRAAVRGLLIALVFPPLITDNDLRGLHDRVTGTAVVRR
ncbi:RDD family protein [Mycolicibacterium thermoresistibile]